MTEPQAVLTVPHGLRLGWEPLPIIGFPPTPSVQVLPRCAQALTQELELRSVRARLCPSAAGFRTMWNCSRLEPLARTPVRHSRGGSLAVRAGDKGSHSGRFWP